MTKFSQLCTLLSTLIFASVLSFAQAPVGNITGTVTDESGAVIPNAVITVSNKESGASRVFTTGNDGNFSASALNAGTYELRAQAPGFRGLIREALVVTGGTTTADLHMQIGQASEVVSVEAATSQIEYERHTIDGVVNRQQVDSLPLNGRSFLQLAQLEPGVRVSSSSLGQYNRQFDVNILGAGSESVRITVDGATVNDSITGGTQQNFSQEVVQEFQVSSVNFDLSTGITGGGAVNVVTRSGGNDFHGSGFFYFRDHNISAYPYLNRDPNVPDPFFARSQTGFYVSGPVIKDKLFFFSSLEHTNQRGAYSAFPTDPIFAAFAVNTTSPYNGNQVTEKIDWRINQKHTAFIRYSHDGNSTFAPSQSSQPSNWANNWNYADSGVFSLISTLTPNIVNEFRYSLTYWHNKKDIPTASQCPAPCYGLGGPQFEVYGVGNLQFGNDASNTPQSRLLRRNIFADNVTWQKGSHRLKFGGEWEHQVGTGTYAYAEPGGAVLYSPQIVQYFNSLVPAPFQIKIPSTFTTFNDILQLPVAGFQTAVGDINQPPAYNADKAKVNDRFHVYLQDTWKVSPRLTLNYGLAYSYESNLLNYDIPKPAYLAPILGPKGTGSEQNSPYNFSPAFGFAYKLTNDNKTVLRGGAGIYYDTMNIEVRLLERASIGPLGTGRVLLDDSIFFSSIASALNFNALPPPLRPTNFSSGPTPFTGAQFVQLLPSLRAAASAQLGQNPTNSDLTIRNINVFKTSPGLDLFVNDFRPPVADHFSVGIQRELARDWVLSADFVYRHFTHGRIRNTDLNHYNSLAGPVIPKCVGAQASNPAAECSTGPITFDISGATSHYTGLLMKLDKRFSKRYTLTGAYQYASQVGYNGEYDQNNFNLSNGPQAPRQVLTISGTVDLPLGFQISMISSYQSANPFEPVINNVDLTGSGDSTLPLPGAGFNEFNISKDKSDLQTLVNQFNTKYAGTTTGRGQKIPTITLPSSYSLGTSFNSQDFRVTKNFKFFSERYKLSIFGEVFNAFNIANLGGYGNSLTSGGFGQPTSRAGQVFGSGGPRAFQFGGRFSF